MRMVLSYLTASNDYYMNFSEYYDGRALIKECVVASSSPANGAEAIFFLLNLNEEIVSPRPKLIRIPKCMWMRFRHKSIAILFAKRMMKCGLVSLGCSILSHCVRKMFIGNIPSALYYFFLAFRTLFFRSATDGKFRWQLTKHQPQYHIINSPLQTTLFGFTAFAAAKVCRHEEAGSFLIRNWKCHCHGQERHTKLCC